MVLQINNGTHTDQFGLMTKDTNNTKATDNTTAPQSEMSGEPSKKGAFAEAEIQKIAREFVRQYYTMLSIEPEHVHRFYSNDSKFSPSHLDRPVCGQQAIQQELLSMCFVDTHVKIHGIKASGVNDNAILIQVVGELSTANQTGRRFMQSFVLSKQGPKKFYALNDIFAYVDDHFSPVPPPVGHSTRDRATSHSEQPRADDLVDSASSPPIGLVNTANMNHEYNDQARNNYVAHRQTPVPHQMSPKAPVFLPAESMESAVHDGIEKLCGLDLNQMGASTNVNDSMHSQPVLAQCAMSLANRSYSPVAMQQQPPSKAVSVPVTPVQPDPAPVAVAPAPIETVATEVVPSVEVPPPPQPKGPKTWATIAGRKATTTATVVFPPTVQAEPVPAAEVPVQTESIDAVPVAVAPSQVQAAVSVPEQNGAGQEQYQECGQGHVMVMETCPLVGKQLKQAYLASLPMRPGALAVELDTQLTNALKEIGCETRSVHALVGQHADRAFAFVEFASAADGDKLFALCKRKLDQNRNRGLPVYCVGLRLWGQMQSVIVDERREKERRAPQTHNTQMGMHRTGYNNAPHAQTYANGGRPVNRGNAQGRVLNGAGYGPQGQGYGQQSMHMGAPRHGNRHMPVNSGPYVPVPVPVHMDNNTYYKRNNNTGNGTAPVAWQQHQSNTSVSSTST